MLKKPVAVLLLLPLLWSCSFVAGLWHMDAVDIIAWFPDRETVQAAEVQKVTVTFSSSMNRVLAEDAFSMMGEDHSLQGHFSWQEGDTVLVFSPEVPLHNGCRFALEVNETAEDLYGNSLSAPFHFSFTTAGELLPPELVLHEPADGAGISSKRLPIRIVFSEPIDPASFYSCFSLFPSVQGGFSWSSAGEEVVFMPTADYQPGETYEVVLGREISDLSGNRLAEEIGFEFSVSDIRQPMIESVTTIGDGELLIPLQWGGGIDPTLEIEKDEGFLFAFSQRPTEEQKIDLFTIEPFTPYALSWDGENRFCELRFEEHLCWNQVYLIDASGLTYTFLVNGERSLPITVAALTYCPDLNAPPGEDKFMLLEFADNVDFSGAAAAAFDFHLQHAPSLEVDLGSFLKSFDMTILPACISVTPEYVELSPLAVDPYPPAEEGRSVVRVHCSIEEDPAVTGTVTFRLSTGLRDTGANHLAEEFVLLVNNN